MADVPKVLLFPPYTADELEAILRHRIACSAVGAPGEETLWDDKAVRLLCLKTAAMKGDARLLLENARCSSLSPSPLPPPPSQRVAWHSL